MGRPPRRGFPKVLRQQLLIAQEHRCAICTGPLSYLDSHVDHIIPLALGGSDDFSNGQVVHMSCNLRKGVGPRRGTAEQERMPWA